MKTPPKSTGYASFRIYLIFFLLMTLHGVCFSQSDDSSRTKYPNIIKYSFSNYLLYQNSLHFGYERVLTRNKSIYVFGGWNEFPVNLNLHIDNAHFSDDKSKSGYSVGASFRFYLSQENKYKAPHGVYLAPFMSYYQFNRSNTLNYTDTSGAQSSASLSTTVSFFNIGAELGYQFVVFKRFVIDAELFGPSFTTYSFKATLAGHLNGLDDNQVLQAVLDALKEKYPLLNDLSSSKTVYGSGVASTKFPAVGFRYALSIGFMF
jgi:hypothetical protein